jgi:hypothetical protein
MRTRGLLRPVAGGAGGQGRQAGHGQFLAWHLRFDATAAQDKRTVAETGDLLEVGRYQQNGAPLRDELTQEMVNLRFRSDIDATRWFFEQEETAAGFEPARENGFLLIAAAQGADKPLRIARADIDARHGVHDATTFETLREIAKEGNTEDARVRVDVLTDGEGSGETLFGALAGDEADTAPHDAGRAAGSHCHTRDAHGTRPPDFGAEEGAPDHVLPGATETDEAKNFAGAEGEIDGADGADAEITHLQQRLGTRSAGGAEHVRELTADDVVDELVRGCARHGRRRDVAAVADDCHPVREAEDLVQPVRDKDDTHAARAQHAQGREEALDVGHGERGGWLVEDEDVRLDDERPGDGDERLIGSGERGDAFEGIDRAADPGEHPRGSVPRFAPGDETARAGIAGDDGDVFGDSHGADQTQILVDEGDGRFRV